MENVVGEGIKTNKRKEDRDEDFYKKKKRVFKTGDSWRKWKRRSKPENSNILPDGFNLTWLWTKYLTRVVTNSDIVLFNLQISF